MMRRTFGWLLFGAGLAGLGYWGHENQAKDIEKMITAEAAGLAQSARHTIDATVSGRDITLSGVAHDEAEKERLLTAAADLTGRRAVQDNISLLPRRDVYTFGARKDADGFTSVTGFAPDADAKMGIASALGLDDVEGLEIAAGAPDANWGSAVSSGLVALSELETGEIAFEGSTARISGSADTSADLGALQAKLDAAPEGYNWDLDVAVTRPDVDNYVFKASKSSANWALGGYMPDAAARDALEAGIEGENSSDIALAANAPEGWNEQIAGAVAALAALESGTLEVSEQGVVISGSAATREEQAAFEAAIAELPGEATIVTDVAFLGAGDDAGEATEANFELALDPISGLVVSGDVPAGLDAAAIAKIVGVAKASGDVSEVEGVDGASQRQLLSRLAPIVGEFENLRISFRGDAVSMQGESLFDADPVRLESYLADIVGADASISVAKTTASFAEGYERPNALTGDVERFAGGYWIPLFDASDASRAECVQRTDAAVERTKIRFQSGSAEIDSISRQVLNRLTGIIGACMTRVADTKILIGGHTDDVGTEADNLDLSNDRARNVLAALAQRGLPADQLSAAGYGEAEPIADNTTDEGRARNRRTTFEWLD